MKNILIIMIGLLLPVILHAQNLEPTQVQLTYYSLNSNSSITTYLSPDLDDFLQNSFLIGWHWDSFRRISDALLTNQTDVYSNNIIANDIVDNSNLMVKLNPGYTHSGDAGLMNARGFTYEPTLQIDSDHPENFTPSQTDQSNPIWGFKDIEPGAANGSLLMLDADNIGQDLNSAHIVLNNPWPSNHISYYADDITDPNINRIYMGYSFYISINLRKDCTGDCNLTALDLENEENILKVEMPYKLGGSTEYLIRFSGIPSPTTSSYTEPANRGKVRNLIDSPDGPTYFYITEAMLPDQEFITINAYFYCDGITGHNHRLQRMPERLNIEDPDWIHDLGIKITYLGRCPISIDWVRIMTPNCKDMLEGVHDVQLISSVQSVLNTMNNQSYYSRHIRPFRFNNVIEGHTQNWIAERYFNKLVGSIGTGEDESLYPDRYEYYVKPADRWIGYYKIPANVSVPYSRYVTDYTPVELLLQTVGTFNGYMGIRGNGSNTRDLETDPVKSHYETYLAHFYDALPISYFLNHDDLPKYEQAINWGNNYGRASYQALHENMLYHSFLSSKCQGLLFSDKFWWGQIFNLCKFANATIEGVEKSYFSQHRPFTGEELRLSMWTPIILGAKGLIYDGVGSEFAFSVEKK